MPATAAELEICISRTPTPCGFTSLKTRIASVLNRAAPQYVVHLHHQARVFFPEAFRLAARAGTCVVHDNIDAAEPRHCGCERICDLLRQGNVEQEVNRAINRVCVRRRRKEGRVSARRNDAVAA